MNRPDPTQQAFFLGREYDLSTEGVLDKPVFYDPRDLTTHGVVVGMTGSGKTGLCVTLLEEAARQGVPSVIVDLKGDLSNLLLAFPEMRPDDFEPWVDADEARRTGTSIGELAAERAERWRTGLAEWGLTADDVARLRDSSDWRVYTPGSEAGRAVSVIRNFAAPPADVGREVLNEKVEATATALLGLMNLPNDPVQDREHILIANLLLHAWTAGKDLDLPRLIAQIQNPPVRTIGTFDVDMFFPEADRLKLAVTLNNLLASPTFATWINGEPLDLARMMVGPDGRPRQSIFYLAHLDDAQRMFFLTLLLQEMLGWTRAQTGSSALRAILYFDEVFGYLPPHPANPPTKQPLMTLLKQARAFGVGVLLATQNPVDLDYKALTNAGTWFIGKLRTDRDKDRLLEGLEGVAAEAGTLTDRQYLDAAISALGNRTFLLHDVHRGDPILFRTRWTMSYLAGPLTREQVARLKPADPPPEEPADVPLVTSGPALCGGCAAETPAGAKFCPTCGRPTAAPSGSTVESGAVDLTPTAETPPAARVPPVLPPGLTQFFLPAMSEYAAGPLLYRPSLLAFAEVPLTDRTRKHSLRREVRLLVVPPGPGMPADWRGAERVPAEMQTALPEHELATWAEVPETINDPRKLKPFEKGLVKHLYDENVGLAVEFNPALGLLSHPEEPIGAFRERCREAAMRALTAELERLEERFAPEGERGKAQDRWHRQAETFKEVRLMVRKADIAVTHFGLAWAPHRPDGEGGWLPAYAADRPAS